MGPLLQVFEFSYPDGYLFMDNGGAICRRLRDLVPGLDTKAIDKVQIEMQMPDQALYLYFGMRRAAIQCTSQPKHDFGALAAEFTSVLTDSLKISSIQSFRFKQVVGRPCASLSEAISLMRPLIPKESQERFGRIAAEPEWRAVQAEYVQNNLAFVDRIAVIDLVPPIDTSVSAELSGRLVPHITVHIDVTGLVPVPVSELDVAAMIHNLGQHHLKTVISRIAPHLSPS